jgi:SulP family sulfate permease
MASSLFGGIVSAGSQSRTMANVINGGRTANSRFASGIIALAVLMLISPLVAELPKVVFAATLVVLALKTFDPWSFRLFSMLFFRGAKLRQLLPDLSVVLLVAATLVLVGVFKAVGAGILISVLFFIFRMGKDIIRREYDGTRIRSNVHRSLEEITYLEENGKKIKVFELEGSLFFGTADKIARVIDHAMETQAVYIVVDLRQVSDIDSTGANILVRIRDRCRDKGREMVLSSVNLIRSREALSTSLSIFEGADQDRNRHSYFDTIDDALAWAEDRLLDERFGADRYDKKLPLSELDIVREFSDSECDLFSGYLAEAVYKAGDVILEQGSSGDRIYFLLQGKVQVVIDLRHESGRQKIATLCPGTVFGEMAIIDRGLRSANVVAQTNISCCYLTTSELIRFNREHPELSHKLMIGFSREISRRVRILNRTITELKG